ncbi:ribosome biogenesis factor YjgA [Povalibacter sp.]|uniref:ribosome biogenesis factor YjgA n=1 Tax=Povalibacter sp. TaxID=1962978 RepID=UPI002F42B579
MTDEDELPSKSERKRQSDDLQALGEALIDLPDNEFDALPLPEFLRDAVLLARRITAHGGLYRQKQYIGKLMRKIDAEPIRVALDTRRDRERLTTLRFRRLEQWRDRIIREGRPALDQFVSECEGGIAPPALAELAALTDQAGKEQREKLPPHASRELFRKLREAMPI